MKIWSVLNGALYGNEKYLHIFFLKPEEWIIGKDVNYSLGYIK
jgi:hypothetical protein